METKTVKLLGLKIYNDSPDIKEVRIYGKDNKLIFVNLIGCFELHNIDTDSSLINVDSVRIEERKLDSNKET